MIFNYPYLEDKEFLAAFDRETLKEHFVRINLLDWEENFLESIEGRATGGSVNIDGKSAIRRSGSVTLLVESGEYNIQDINSKISMNKKVSIEVGLSNTTRFYEAYPIIWFPLGVFVITNANIQKNNQGLSIALTIKDKMCLLNGECGGSFTASVELDTMNSVDPVSGAQVKDKPTIYEIIREVVHEFGDESYNKIIIQDIENTIKRRLKWLGAEPIELKSEGYEPIIISTGQDIGYSLDKFYYPSELLAKAGESVVTVLDKIKNALGNFEYFYDIEGNLIFREIKNYLNNNSTINYIDYSIDLFNGKAVYSFEDGLLISAYSNNPQYNLIKNDFVVWGERKTSEGKYPIRYHLAIDEKPSIGNSYEVFLMEDAFGNIIAKWPIRISDYKWINGFTPVAETLYVRENGKCFLFTNNQFVEQTGKIATITTQDWRTELYL